METGYATLTVYFENPFWVGLYQRSGGGTEEVCRIVFGPEPKDYEVYAFLLENYHRLQFSPPMEVPEFAERHVNPKRLQRQIRERLQTLGTGTKARQALALQREQGKAAKKRRAREDRETARQRRFALRREKQREKHRGH